MSFKDYAKYYDQIYKNKDYKKEAEFVYKWAGKPKSILEIGCGTGQHAKYFPKRCVHIGIDKSLEMINQCPQTTPKRFFKSDICDYKRGELDINVRFDAVFALFNVVGYVDIERFIENLLLKKGGYFIFDCWTWNSGYDLEYRKKEFDSFTKYVFPLGETSSHCFLRILIINDNNKVVVDEIHHIRGYSTAMIELICSVYNYELVEIKYGKGWINHYKLRKL